MSIRFFDYHLVVRPIINSLKKHTSKDVSSSQFSQLFLLSSWLRQGRPLPNYSHRSGLFESVMLSQSNSKLMHFNKQQLTKFKKRYMWSCAHLRKSVWQCISMTALSAEFGVRCVVRPSVRVSKGDTFHWPWGCPMFSVRVGSSYTYTVFKEHPSLHVLNKKAVRRRGPSISNFHKKAVLRRRGLKNKTKYVLSMRKYQSKEVTRLCKLKTKAAPVMRELKTKAAPGMRNLRHHSNLRMHNVQSKSALHVRKCYTKPLRIPNIYKIDNQIFFLWFPRVRLRVNNGSTILKGTLRKFKDRHIIFWRPYIRVSHFGTKAARMVRQRVRKEVKLLWHNFSKFNNNLALRINYNVSKFNANGKTVLRVRYRVNVSKRLDKVHEASRMDFRALDSRLLNEHHAFFYNRTNITAILHDYRSTNTRYMPKSVFWDSSSYESRKLRTIPFEINTNALFSNFNKRDSVSAGNNDDKQKSAVKHTSNTKRVKIRADVVIKKKKSQDNTTLRARVLVEKNKNTYSINRPVYIDKKHYKKHLTINNFSKNKKQTKIYAHKFCSTVDNNDFKERKKKQSILPLMNKERKKKLLRNKKRKRSSLVKFFFPYHFRRLNKDYIFHLNLRRKSKKKRKSIIKQRGKHISNYNFFLLLLKRTKQRKRLWRSYYFIRKRRVARRLLLVSKLAHFIKQKKRISHRLNNIKYYAYKSWMRKYRHMFNKYVTFHSWLINFFPNTTAFKLCKSLTDQKKKEKKVKMDKKKKKKKKKNNMMLSYYTLLAPHRLRKNNKYKIKFKRKRLGIKSSYLKTLSKDFIVYFAYLRSVQLFDSGLPFDLGMLSFFYFSTTVSYSPFFDFNSYLYSLFFFYYYKLFKTVLSFFFLEGKMTKMYSKKTNLFTVKYLKLLDKQKNTIKQMLNPVTLSEARNIKQKQSKLPHFKIQNKIYYLFRTNNKFLRLFRIFFIEAVNSLHDILFSRKAYIFMFFFISILQRTQIIPETIFVQALNRYYVRKLRFFKVNQRRYWRYETDKKKYKKCEPLPVEIMSYQLGILLTTFFGGLSKYLNLTKEKDSSSYVLSRFNPTLTNEKEQELTQRSEEHWLKLNFKKSNSYNANLVSRRSNNLKTKYGVILNKVKNKNFKLKTQYDVIINKNRLNSTIKEKSNVQNKHGIMTSKVSDNNNVGANYKKSKIVSNTDKRSVSLKNNYGNTTHSRPVSVLSLTDKEKKLGFRIATKPQRKPFVFVHRPRFDPFSPTEENLRRYARREKKNMNDIPLFGTTRKMYFLDKCTSVLHALACRNKFRFNKKKKQKNTKYIHRYNYNRKKKIKEKKLLKMNKIPPRYKSCLKYKYDSKRSMSYKLKKNKMGISRYTRQSNHKFVIVSRNAHQNKWYNV